MSNETPEPSSTKTELIGSIIGTFDTLTHKVKQEMRKRPIFDCGLADGHMFILALLLRCEQLKASDVAAELGITSGAVTGLTDKLAGMGFVARDRSEEDRRVVLLSLTEEGKACFSRIRKERMDRIAALFGKLEEEDLQKLLDVFRNLLSVLDKE